MKVLHDYDNGHLSRGYAWRRGRELIIYAATRKLGLKTSGKIDSETDNYLETIIKLDRLCGVEPIIGLRDTVIQEKPHLVEVVNKFGADLRIHQHIGSEADPNRRRTWNPPLTQPQRTWHYEADWINGGAEALESGELPIWHVDYPYLIDKYIDFLYAWRFEGRDPYQVEVSKLTQGCGHVGAFGGVTLDGTTLCPRCAEKWAEEAAYRMVRAY